MKRILAGLLPLAILGAALPGAAQTKSIFDNPSPFGSKKPKDKDGDPDNNNGWGNNPTNVPFDGGVGLLLAAGAAYGIKKYRAKKIAQS